MNIESIYHGISYKISYIGNERFGPYYDMRLFIDNQLKAHERLSTPKETIERLIERLQTWDLEDKGLNMSEEQANDLISEWKTAWTLLESMSEEEGESKRVADAFATIFCNTIDLCEAGYCTNDGKTDWHLLAGED